MKGKWRASGETRHWNFRLDQARQPVKPPLPQVHVCVRLQVHVLVAPQPQVLVAPHAHVCNVGASLTAPPPATPRSSVDVNSASSSLFSCSFGRFMSANSLRLLPIETRRTLAAAVRDVHGWAISLFWSQRPR